MLLKEKKSIKVISGNSINCYGEIIIVSCLMKGFMKKVLYDGKIVENKSFPVMNHGQIYTY